MLTSRSDSLIHNTCGAVQLLAVFRALTLIDSFWWPDEACHVPHNVSGLLSQSSSMYITEVCPACRTGVSCLDLVWCCAEDGIVTGSCYGAGEQIDVLQ